MTDAAPPAVWIPVGSPGFSGERKQQRTAILDQRFGADGWRWAWAVRGAIVGFDAAIAEYEQAYRTYLSQTPAAVDWLVATCGNVYDFDVSNVFDHHYAQPTSIANHYQDISVRRVIAELTGAAFTPPSDQREPLIDLDSGSSHLVPRAPGFTGRYLGQIRGPESALYFLNPAVVPVHDPSLITTVPGRTEWYHSEGCGHLSVEAFWQSSKVIEVRYDRFAALGPLRVDPLQGL